MVIAGDVSALAIAYNLSGMTATCQHPAGRIDHVCASVFSLGVVFALTLAVFVVSSP
jgi:hypothetical protein